MILRWKNETVNKAGIKYIISPFDELPLASTDFDEKHSTKIEIVSSSNSIVAQVITHYPEDINSKLE